MTTPRNRVLAAALALLMAPGTGTCTTPPAHTPASGASPPSGTSPVSARTWLLRASAASLVDQVDAARICYENAIHSPDFDSLGTTQRFAVLYETAMAEWRAGNAARANVLLARATGYKLADANTWRYRMMSASESRNYLDMAYSLTTIARRWPATLHTLFPGAPLQLHRELQKYQQDDADQKMLDALFAAHWPPENDGADYLWLDLAAIHLRNGEMKQATRAALRIRQPMLVLSMRVDKRFDPIRRRHPEAFDIDRLLRTQIRDAQARAKAHPNRLGPIQTLQNLYILSGHFERALSVSDPAVAVGRKGEGPSTYSDFYAKYNWVLDNRASAMTHQGHWKRAIRAMLEAARQSEFGSMNVSQRINLAAYYASNRLPGKAAKAIAKVGNMSPFGRMQLESIKLEIAIERHDRPAITRAMAYLRANRADAIKTWQDALLLHGDLDEAAALLIRRLENPDWRDDALLSVQDYPDGPESYLGKRIDAGWKRIMRRKDVLAALHRVGRIEHTDLNP